MSSSTYTFPQQIAKHMMICTIVLLASCTGKTGLPETFDSEKWKNDLYSCKGDRTKLIDIILENKEALIGEAEHNIIQVLGRGDKMELGPKKGKIYHYYITAGPSCNDTIPSGKVLHVEFESLGRVKLITVQPESYYR